jgi:MFS family permease
LATAAFLGNLFVAPASLYQNSYLDDVRGYSARLISVFTLVTATPAGLGILAGGRIADARGRRLLGGLCLLAGVAFAVLSFVRSGWIMWVSALAGLFGGAAYPALSVYRTELLHSEARRGRWSADRLGVDRRQHRFPSPAGPSIVAGATARYSAPWPCSMR